MTKTMKQAYAEVDEILKFMPKEYVDKIPLKFRNLFSECRDRISDVKIDPNKTLKEQRIMYETRVIIAVLKYNFWCENEEEKNKILEKIKLKEKLALEKYDISALASKRSIFVDDTEQEKNYKENLPVKFEKQSWLSKILSKFKNIFKR